MLNASSLNGLPLKRNSSAPDGTGPVEIATVELGIAKRPRHSHVITAANAMSTIPTYFDLGIFAEKLKANPEICEDPDAILESLVASVTDPKVLERLNVELGANSIVFLLGPTI
jgi:hypothetical protein